MTRPTAEQAQHAEEALKQPTPALDPDQLARALLALLRKLNDQVPDRPPLEGRALLAVQNFQQISLDLHTLADPALGTFSDQAL